MSVVAGAPAKLRATYRLQLSSRFGFAGARGLISYLRDLGISHLYLSPSLQARPGSEHGYDVVDPGRLSDELGGRASFEALARAAHDAGMGLILDVVPNHMAADPANRYWQDPELRARFFDVDPVTGRARRFFDIDELVGLRQEDPGVFEATHQLLLSLVREGLLDGLRVDHPDGLANPAEYFERLRSAGARRVWIEKILDRGEHLRDWPVCGTVGYEFLNDVCALFVDPAAEPRFTELWSAVSGDSRGFEEIAFEAKLEQARGTFAPEVQRLVRELGQDARTETLVRALSSLPVYRTYVDPAQQLVTEEDRAALSRLDEAIRRRLLLDEPAPEAFVTRFQQTTPAIMAKGVEDTAFYRYARLLALNDVGGDPSRFGIGPEQFHAGCLERSQRFPFNLLSTQTHDAKRSADVRARIGALSSVPADWATHVERWLELTEPLRVDGAPDDVERYFLFQTLIGAWPIELGRLLAYMTKALREAKRNTNWVEQNLEYEQAVERFCRALYAHKPFIDDFVPFAQRVAAVGDRAALGQVALKLTSPGIPDIYQGDELPYRALVDPDNRRTVDWDWRMAMLSRLMGGGRPVAETLKLFLILRLLGLRGRRPEPFAGSYEPLEAGPQACAFVRGGDVLTVVSLTRGEDLGGAALDAPTGGRWRELLSGDQRSFAAREQVADLVGDVGVAVYERL